jgi:hypothetical protein
MFLTKGIISMFGSKPRKFDINSLPDLDNESEVQSFITSISQELKSFHFSDELRTLLDFLVEASEKYDILHNLSEVWQEALEQSFSTELLQNMLDISLNAADKNPNFFNVKCK